MSDLENINGTGENSRVTKYDLLKFLEDKNEISQDIVNDEIKIEDEKNNILEFHKLIFATHANQVLDILEKPTEEEVKIFSQFKYSTNSAILHSDHSLMPKSKIAWSSWNFLNKSSSSKFTLTYWMNFLQKLPTKQNYFVTVNPYKKPKNIICLLYTSPSPRD